MINRNMGCIEMDLDVLIELPELMINRNMGCIEIATQGCRHGFWQINRNMGCIEMRKQGRHRG